MSDSGSPVPDGFAAGQRGPAFLAPEQNSAAPPTLESPPIMEPQPTPRRPRLAYPIILVVGVLLIIGAATGIVIMMTSQTAARPMPEDTARAFVEAAYRSDCDAVRITIADEFWDGAQLTCLDVSFHGTDFVDTTVADWTFTDTVITGDTASINVDPPSDIPPTALHMRLVDGMWKITNWQF